MEVNKKTVSSNLIWRWLERCGAQGVTFIVSLVLARVLSPDHYGAIAKLLAINAVLNVFVDSGLGNALIQKKDADETDFSTVFFFNIVLSITMYWLLYFFAPILSVWIKNPDLTQPIRVMGIIVLISGVKNVQQAYVSRNLLFKKFFFATFIGTAMAGASGIVLALWGYGIWALVAQYLVVAFVSTICLWLIVPWRPQKSFSFKKLKQLFSFGSKLMISSLIDTLYKELRTFLIGIKYQEADLGLYNEGEKFPKVIVTNINSSIDSVLLPSLSKEQDNVDRVKAMTRRAIQIGSYIMMPFMMGLAVCAEPLIRLVLTEKWIGAVPFLQIFCVSYALHPIQTANLNAIKALGRSDIYMKLEIVKKIIGVSCIVVTMFLGVKAIAIGCVVATVMDSFVNAYPNKKLMNYSIWEQIRDMLPPFMLSFAMGLCVFGVGLITNRFFGQALVISLLIQIVLGVIVYVGLSLLLKEKSFFFVLSMIRSLLQSGKKKKAQKSGADLKVKPLESVETKKTEGENNDECAR